MNDNKTLFSCYINEPELLLTTSARMNYIILAIISSFLGAVSLSLNLIFLITILKQNMLYIRSNVLLSVLSICDLLTCILVIPAYSFFMIALSKQTIICEVSRYLKMIGYSTTSMSMTTIVAITIDLYIAVVKPFFYESNYKTKTVVKILIFVWVSICVISALSMYVLHIWRIYMMSVGGLAIFFYFFMFLLRYRINKETLNMTKMSARGDRYTIFHRKTLKLASAVLIVFGVAYVPTVTMMVFKTVFGSNQIIKSYVDQWCDMFALTNIIWNPIVYYYRMKKFREKIIDLFCFRTSQSCGNSVLPNISRFDVTRPDLSAVEERRQP